MKIIQIAPAVSYGDAVGNDALALLDVLARMKYETAIYTADKDVRIKNKLVFWISELPCLQKEDIIIYHFAIGTGLNYEIAKLPGRKILIYHNVTPYHFMYPYNKKTAQLCKEGIREAKYLANKVDYCLAVSDYNKKNLRKMGYQCKIDVLPILIPFSDYENKPNEQVLKKYKNDGYTNIIFTGRIAPNKKHEDVIAAFYEYQKYFNPKSRLFLVGNYNGMEKYYFKLKAYVKKLKVKNVIFTGHISFDEILAYYSLADLFLCMSEHEGFCVPLVEAMYFQVPIVAYDSTAIGGTLGESGVLLKKKNALETAAIIDKILNKPEWQAQIIQSQQKRLQDYSHDRIEKMFCKYLDNFINS